MSRRIAWSRFEPWILAAVAYVPQLLSRPGVVDTDTKTYLYLETGPFVRHAASMWDPTMGTGTVTHENIGYLWPMGPFFWSAHAVGVPLWAAQRLWVGTILFAAGAGVLFLCRVLRLEGPGRFVAALAYMLSPYSLQYLGRISVLLLPWAGLGWLTGFAVLAVRHKGWRYPALFALVWLTISGTNVTGAVYAAVAPALWLLYALATKLHSLRQIWAGLWRTALLVATTSLWWIAALGVENRYGLSILNYTEQPIHIANSSLASEVLRGLGYWYYYGFDRGGSWAPTSAGYMTPWLIATSFAVPLLALGAGVLLRWRGRGYLVLVVVVGMVLAVGAHPYGTPSVVGAVLKYAMNHNSVGLALRSTDRATPIVVLGLAMLLGVGVSAAARHRPTAGKTLTVLSVGLVAAANPAMWDGQTVSSRYSMPDPLPSYVRQAARSLNAEHTQTRVLAIPGENFGAYTWGDTTDPVWPGVLTRPFATREQFPMGSLPTYDLLYALDDPMQDRTLDPKTIAPLARLMSVGDVLVQNDLDYTLYNQPQPQQLWQQLEPSPPGLGPAEGFGAPRPNRPSTPVIDPSTIATTTSSVWPSPLEVLPVKSPRPLVRAEPTTGAVVVDGDGVGLADIAGLGLLDTSAPVLYAGTLDEHRRLTSQTLGGATLVVTDTNRRQQFFWSRIQGNAGPTVAASAPTHTPLDIFGHSTPSGQTTSSLVGVSSITAHPENQSTSTPSMAVDGTPDTAWIATPPAEGRWWEVQLALPVTTSSIDIAQAVRHGYEIPQWITSVTLTFDNSSSLDVELGPSSRTPAGQTVTFPSRTFQTLEITIDSTNLTNTAQARSSSASPVGLAEVRIPGVTAQKVTVMPTDLLTSLGPGSQVHRLVVVMTRLRASADTPASDPEPVLTRSFTLPKARSFSLSGTARINGTAADQLVDGLVGRTGGAGGLVSAYSSERLSGALRDTASAALDGDPRTMWSPDLGSPDQRGAWIEVDLNAARTLDHLELTVASDRNHSLPTVLQIRSCGSVPAGGTCPSGSEARTVALPAIRTSATPGALTTLPLTFAPLAGRDFTFTFTGVHVVKKAGYHQSGQLYGITPNPEHVGLPLGIAELGIPGVRAPSLPSAVPSACRSDLLTVDGSPVPVRLTGATSTALSAGGLALVPCGADAQGITLGPGEHVVAASYGGSTGVDVDQLVLDSAAGGGAAPAETTGAELSPPAAPSTGAGPRLHVVSSTSTGMELRITGATKPFWLVLGESVNKGWQLRVNGKAVSGQPVLIDGFANGWLVDPGRHASTTTVLDVSVRWTPQSLVNLALLGTVAATAACLALVLWPRRRRRRRPAWPAEPLATGASDRVTGIAAPLALAVAAATASVGALLLPTLDLAFFGFVVVFLLVLMALVHPPYRLVLRVLAAAGGLGALAVMLVESTKHYPYAELLGHAEWASRLAWVAVILLAADVVVGAVLRRWRATR